MQSTKPGMYVVAVESGAGRWFALTEYPDALTLLDGIQSWVSDRGSRAFAIREYRRMADLGLRPSWRLVDAYIRALHEGADPEQLAAYVDGGGQPLDVLCGSST